MFRGGWQWLYMFLYFFFKIFSLVFNECIYIFQCFQNDIEWVDKVRLCRIRWGRRSKSKCFGFSGYYGDGLCVFGDIYDEEYCYIWALYCSNIDPRSETCWVLSWFGDSLLVKSRTLDDNVELIILYPFI